MATTRRGAAAALCLLLLAPAHLDAQGSTLDNRTRARAKVMLKDVRDAIKDNYYDPAFHGVDIEARFKEAETRLETAQSLGHAMAIIAQAMLELGDSHTYFIPPARAESYDYGWQVQMIGDECYVTGVKAGSDAAAKGLKPGDRVLRIDPFLPKRGELWKVQYLYNVLSPRTALKLVVQSPGGVPRELETASKVTRGQKLVTLSLPGLLNDLDQMSRAARAYSARSARIGDVAVWKLASFGFDPADVDEFVDGSLKGASALVVDLRGNAGGLVATLQQVAGRLFDHDVKLADVKGRKSTRAMVAKARKTPFTGRIVALVDNSSASAAEMLARVLQIEKRGTVIGDGTAGSVMQATMHPMSMGLDTMIFYGASVAEADLIMTDGRSLERVGVTPDERLLPTAEDLASGRDPVLARAIALLGGTLDPTAAGKLFPSSESK
jgi:carboxyl-terminal processing protease